MSEEPTEVWFYHLTHWPLDRVLPQLLEKSLERGWRALIRSGAPERLEALDAHLWTYKDDGFMPHGLDDEDGPRQPVLLTTSMEDSNEADLLFVIDRAETGDVSCYQRCIFVFDGNDQDAVAMAREEWKKAKEAGFGVSYWQQNERGGFEQKA